MQSNSNIDVKVVFPPIIGADELGVLLKRKNINSDKCRRPHTVPESYKPTDTLKPLWITEDVIQWLRQFKETPKHIKKKIGAPTKAERVAKRKASHLGEA